MNRKIRWRWCLRAAALLIKTQDGKTHGELDRANKTSNVHKNNKERHGTRGPQAPRNLQTLANHRSKSQQKGEKTNKC
jgi:hypothetical protein